MDFKNNRAADRLASRKITAVIRLPDGEKISGRIKPEDFEYQMAERTYVVKIRKKAYIVDQRNVVIIVEEDDE